MPSANRKLYVETAPLLRRALIGNAIFSAISALILSAFAPEIAALVGLSEPDFARAIGLGLMPWAAFLFISARRPRLPVIAAISAIIGDVGWVLASAIGSATLAAHIPASGLWAIGTVAFAVAGFAIVQTRGISQAT